MLLRKIKKCITQVYILAISIALLSCKTKEANYIIYYNKVNEIDSLYRIANKPEKAIKKYHKLFRKYSPKNQERIEEYLTYIKISDKYNRDFGGQESLYKLIPLIAPYGNDYKDLFSLYQKYGIDSTEVNQKVKIWKNSLNKQLIDSFNIAMIRDQDKRHVDTIAQAKNVKKNAELLMSTFKNSGYPSLQKIGTMPMHTLLTHMNESKKYYPYIKSKLIEYVKSGDCPPLDYAMMFDSYHVNVEKGNTTYGFSSFNPIVDSAQVNRNRKSIGLPSLKHSAKIKKDFMAQIKKK